MIREGFRFRVNYVKHQDTKIGTITKFQIGDKIKDGDGFINYNVTVFQDLPLSDGDSIKLLKIKSLEVREYTNRNGEQRKSFDMVADVEIEKATPQATPQVPDDDGSLPFDL